MTILEMKLLLYEIVESRVRNEALELLDIFEEEHRGEAIIVPSSHVMSDLPPKDEREDGFYRASQFLAIILDKYGDGILTT